MPLIARINTDYKKYAEPLIDIGGFVGFCLLNSWCFLMATNFKDLHKS